MAKKRKKKAKKRKKKTPSANGQSDRDNSGQFVEGNKASVGNVKGTDRKSKELKKALLDAVTEKDIKAIAKKILLKAKKGDIPAIKELFDRLWGRPIQGVEVGIEDETRLMFEEWLKSIDGSGSKSPIEQIRGKGK